MPAYVHLRPGDPLPEFPVALPFKAVVVAELACAPEWRTAVAIWLVGEGCRYAMSWGVDCVIWEDAIDWACAEHATVGEGSEATFVMTTSHDNEPLSDAFWFCGSCAIDPVHDLGPGLIVHIARNPDPEGMIRTYLHAQPPQG